MRPPILAIDLGSSSIKALAAKADSTELEIIFPAHCKSSGIKQGVPVNIEETAEQLDNLISEMETMLKNVSFKELIVGIGGTHLESRLSKGTAVVSRADQEIVEEDKIRARKAAEAFALPPNRTLVQTVLRNYIVDGVAKVKDPVGMKGLKIEAECLLIDAFTPYITYIDRLGEIMGMKFNTKIVLPFAGAEVALTAQDKDLGAVALDLGASTTSMCVYEDNEILDLKVLPMGGSHITNDIALGLKTYVDVAEKIKINEGIAIKKKVDKNKNINLSTYWEEANLDEKVSKRFLAEIIEARLSEIFDLVADRLKKTDRFGRLPGGIVLYGGSAKIPYITELAKEKFNLPVRLARPEIEWFKENPDLAFIPLLGLLSLKLQEQGTSSSFGKSNIFVKISNFFKNLLQI